jgi:NitT/TauT family transport system substrate-binding protein
VNKVSRNLAVLVASAALVTGLSSCSSPGARADEVQRAMSEVDYDCSKPDRTERTNVSLTAMPLVSNGALYAGIDQGFFKKHGLNPKISTVSTIPATISAVQGGTADFAFTGNISTFQALAGNIKVSIVAPFAGLAPGYWDKMQAGVKGYTREINALLVAPKSPIKTPGDLTGKTVAVTDAKGQSELITRYVIKAHDGDPDKVKFVVMSFADSVNALMAGKVDAAYSTEPSMTKAERAGYRIISWPGPEALHEGPTSSMIASNDFIVKHPETVARFNCAMREANAYGNTHHDVVRRTIAREQGVPPASLANAVVPHYFTTMDVAGLKRFADITESFGFIRKSLDMKSVVIPQARN